MQDRTVYRRRNLGLAVAGLIVAVGAIWAIHDAIFLAALVCAVSLLWSTREWKAWLVAAALVAAGLFWSWADAEGCSAWWKGRIVYEKLAGHLPYIGWPDLRRLVLAPCSAAERSDWKAADRMQLLEQRLVDGRKWERYQTELGNFWLPAPGKHLLHGLVWEMTVRVPYGSEGVAIRPGDTVIDCGAHVGVFSRYALRQGAGRVIAIEPDPTNIACLEANLAPEIAAGQVNIVKAGVWHQKGYLTLSHSDEDSAKHSFVEQLPHSSSIAGLPVLTLDEIVEQLKLARVDFIKMDIEGSERFALQGAKQTITRFRPKMAICTYHVGDDVDVIPSVVRMMQPMYEIYAKDIEPVRILGTRRMEMRLYVLFFH